jgi:serine/threonine-protein kinase
VTERPQARETPGGRVVGVAAPTRLTEGALFFQGRYRIVRCLREGGMGAVYECIHLATRKRRALKVMHPQILALPGMRERFEFEARATAEIESDHIVETFDAGVDEVTGTPFLVMELLRGDDLASIVQAHGAFTPKETLVLLSQAALALDQTHAAGIVHRDLKLENLFLSAKDGGSTRLKVLDFGIAVGGPDAASLARGRVMGTPLFMAPEQASGGAPVGAAADLYALGHIAYAMLVGEPYWTEEHDALPLPTFLATLSAGATELASARAARRGGQLPPAFDAWFARSTATSPHARFDRASTQIADLATALDLDVPRPSVRDAVARLQRAEPPARDSSDQLPAYAGSSRPASRTPLRLLAVAGACLALAGALAGVLARVHATVAAAPALAAAPVSSATTVASSATALSSLPSADAVAASATGLAASAAPIATSAGTVAVRAAPTAPEREAPTHARASIQARRGAVSSAAFPCRPPYTVDALGVKHAKLECL